MEVEDAFAKFALVGKFIFFALFDLQMWTRGGF